ncbi:hypothetical protein Q427_33695 [Halomonas sp. BC04]|nr:hypothetical protein Q427_33695 [Halomonas sp. BC04]
MALDVSQHLAGLGLGQLMAQTVVLHVAGEHVTVNGAVVKLVPLLVACCLQRLAHGAVTGLGMGNERQTDGCRREPGGGADNRVSMAHGVGLRKAEVGSSLSSPIGAYLSSGWVTFYRVMVGSV